MAQICATMVHLKGNNVQLKFVLVTRTLLFKPTIPPSRGSVLGDTFQLMKAVSSHTLLSFSTS